MRRPAVGVGDAAAVVHFGAEAFVGVNEVGFLSADGFPQASTEGVVVVVGNHGLGVVFDLGLAVFQVVDVVGVDAVFGFENGAAVGVVAVAGAAVVGVALQLVVVIVEPFSSYCSRRFAVAGGVVGVGFIVDGGRVVGAGELVLAVVAVEVVAVFGGVLLDVADFVIAVIGALQYVSGRIFAAEGF